MKYNYPIKYAVIPMVEQVGYYAEGEREYGTVAYIATKCYLIGESKEYNAYGDLKQQYHVVFPYELASDYSNSFNRIKPSYNASNKCSNSISVDSIFDTFEDAALESEIKNKELLSSNPSYAQCIEKYKILEETIEEKTKDLVVGETPKEQTTIRIGKNLAFLDISLYYILDSSLYPNLCVYNVSQEEYNKMIKQIEDNIMPSVNNQRCLIQKKQDIIQIHNYNSTEKKGCFYLKKFHFQNDILQYDENMLPFTSDDEFNNGCISIYTLETYDDVIGSFIENLNKDEITVNGKTFAKRIKLK